MRKIELLSPAKNADIGIEAIKHGADAVYIGADRFSARAAAGNSVEDIARLVEFAHMYNARVYVALNTVLRDDQMDEAEKLIHELYNIGVDALIVQDMGIMELNLPPIELHASTQTDNRDAAKVKFLEQVGFKQVVLARELTLDQIKSISSQTSVPLEVFVHGALCVSYSGQCYISEALSKRSANRGACAQYCRLPYDLVDSNGKVIAKSKHLLSLKDMNQSDSLEQLIDAGVTSLKIEGRLKDVGYVKNITAYYRKRLDAIFKKRADLSAKSSGRTTFTFEPDATRSFNRGFTNYYLKGRSKDFVYSPDTPKSVGQYVGTVKEIKKGSFTVAGLVALNNGDGLCFKSKDGSFKGFRVNRVEDNRVFPAEWPEIEPKMELYRNFDHEFEKELSKESAQRKISVSIRLEETESGFKLRMTDEDNFFVETEIDHVKEVAKNPQFENQKKQLTKLGNTIFEATAFESTLSDEFFIPSSLLTSLKREAAERLEAKRISDYKRDPFVKGDDKAVYPFKELTYLGNVTNSKAESFYSKHGVESIDKGFELIARRDVPLMFTKHCVKYSLGLCARFQGYKGELSEPLFLVYQDKRLRLQFNCKDCEMKIYSETEY